MTSITFYGGAGEIGGNKILLESDEGRVFLDFGKNFDLENQYFDFPLIQPFYIPDLKNVGALPDIRGLYRNSDEKPSLDAVMISHPHTDHYAYISMLDGEIPVFLGKSTKNIIQVRNNTYRDYWDMKISHLDFNTFKTGDEFEVAGLKFKPIHVDHSVPAAYGYLIYAGEKTIGYTGDFRYHGTKGELTEDFMEALEAEEIDVLICEGTNVDPEDEDEFLRSFEEEYHRKGVNRPPKRVRKECDDEEDVKRKMVSTVERIDGVVMVETSPADVDRIRTVWQVARATGREFLLDPRQAYLTYKLAGAGRISNLPSPENSEVFMDRKRMRKQDRSPEDPEDLETGKKWRDRWQQELFEMGEVCWGPEGRKKVRRNCDNYILCTSNATRRLMELRYEKPCNCGFILSKSEPFNEEMVITFDKLLHWLDLYGISRYYQMHVSGHASSGELQETIQRVNPKKLFPIHTESPGEFKELVKNAEVICPKHGGRYMI